MHDTGAPRLERGPVDGRRSPRVRGGGARAPDRRAPRAGGARGRAHGGEGPRGRRARAGGARRGPRRDGEPTGAPREPVRGQGARRGVAPGFPARRGGARRSGATMTDERRWLDRLCERATRALARRTSRRSFLTRLGTALAGTAALPL